jgi:hypothetical protein
MAEELLKKIPPEKRWELTARFLTKLNTMRIHRTRPHLGIGEGITSPIMGWEKFQEIQEKIWHDNGRNFLPWIKETFNIQVEDAIGAIKLAIVAGRLNVGPAVENTIVEATPERSVRRSIGCAWWVRHKESGLAPELSSCPRACQIFFEEGFKAVNAKIAVRLTKSLLWGDPYCEWIFEFKEE